MEHAKEYLKNGSLKTITAEEANKKYFHTISSKQGKFFCLYCGEEVAFVRRSKENHKPFFRHSNEKENSNICEKRNSVENYSSIYEKLGLPLYLENLNNGYFQLNIGFYKIDSEILNQLEIQEAEIILKSENKLSFIKYNIDSSRFLSNRTTLLKLDFLSSKYSIIYSKDSFKDLLSWGDSADGISSEGALFKYDTKMFRKLRINDEIYFDTNYILVRDKNTINFIDIDLQELGCLEINKKFIVYKLKISSKNEENYNHLRDFFRSNFKLNLTTSPINLIPLWPPSIAEENQIFSFSANSSISIINSNYNEVEIYIHEDEIVEKVNTKKIRENVFLFDLLHNGNDQTISINDKYGANCYTYKQIPFKPIDRFINYSITNIIGDKIENGIHFYLPKKNIIKISVDIKCEILVLNKGQIKYFYKLGKNKKELIIDKLEFGDTVFIINGIERIFLVCFEKKNKNLLVNNFDWNLLLSELRKSKSYFVPVPPYIYKILKSIPKDTKLFAYIKNAIFENQIQHHALVLLLEKYKGVNHERN